LPVLGGEDDGTEAELIPRVGRDMMLEPERARVAERIEARLANQGF
jgi:hypothetical protein